MAEEWYQEHPWNPQPASPECQARLCESAVAAGFTRRGKAYFRIVGDGVLQVVKFEYERGPMLHILNIGLFSMYGELMPQWFTSGGCIPRYEATQVGLRLPTTRMRMKDGYAFSERISPKKQVEIFSRFTIEKLNQVRSQAQLFDMMLQLDPGWWNDLEKYAPSLASGDRASAVKVITAILSQHAAGQEKQKALLPKEVYEHCRSRLIEEDAALQRLKDLAETGSDDAVRQYLQKNYETNLKYALFCSKNRKILK